MSETHVTDSDFGNSLSTPVARALYDLQEDILATWELRVRTEIKQASEMTQPVLLDTIPKFLANTVEALSRRHPRKFSTEATNLPCEHGLERARWSKYEPDHVAQEYQILREVILDKLEPAVALDKEDRFTIHYSIDTSMRGSIKSFYADQLRVKEQFVFSLTHDMRNPLSVAKLSAEIILRSLDAMPESDAIKHLKHVAQRALINTKRVDGMIRDLLDSNLLQAGEMLALTIEECDILKLARDVVADFSEKEKGRIKLEGPSCQGKWDGDALRRAIENLLTNAMKYGSRGSPITVKIAPGYERVQISVHNSGNSIAPEDQKKLFKPFHRTRSAKDSGVKGWGIGLSLSHGVAASHGGSLLLDSTPERGTTFTIDIPVNAEQFQKHP